MKSTTVILSIAILLCIPRLLSAQDYTLSKYDYHTNLDIVYKNTIDFAGNPKSLSLDIYKPIKDNNCRRPIVVMAHGGSWIAGTRKDQPFVQLAYAFAKRGYVVASIEYRLGTHKTTGYSKYALCPDELACVYNYDSIEFYRANYRGMQDMKDAIKFMKARHQLDSSDPNITFLVGESAGGFIAFWSAYLNEPIEKPISCGTLPNVMTAAATTNFCYTKNILRERNDLGDINGELLGTGYNTNVLGVACLISGSIGNLSFTPQDPVLYTYHNTHDAVVDPYTKGLFVNLYNSCLNPLNICQPMDATPIVKGGFALIKLFKSDPNNYPTTYDDNQNTGNNFCDTNFPGHATYEPIKRVQNMCNFFAPIILKNGNKPSANCLTGINDNHSLVQAVFINQNNQNITIANLFPDSHIEIVDLQGNILSSIYNNKATIINMNIGQLKNTCKIIFVRISTQNNTFTKKLVLL